MRAFTATLFAVCLTVVHGLIVVSGTLSLPLVLLYPGTRPYVLLGIGIMLVSWTLFSDCPLTTIDRRIRDYLRWPELKDDFISHHFSTLTGYRVPRKVHRLAERVYLSLVVLVIVIR